MKSYCDNKIQIKKPRQRSLLEVLWFRAWNRLWNRNFIDFSAMEVPIPITVQMADGIDSILESIPWLELIP